MSWPAVGQVACPGTCHSFHVTTNPPHVHWCCLSIPCPLMKLETETEINDKYLVKKIQQKQYYNLQKCLNVKLQTQKKYGHKYSILNFLYQDERAYLRILAVAWFESIFAKTCTHLHTYHKCCHFVSHKSQIHILRKIKRFIFRKHQQSK